jgi:hypothetical protein
LNLKQPVHDEPKHFVAVVEVGLDREKTPNGSVPTFVENDASGNRSRMSRLKSASAANTSGSARQARSNEASQSFTRTESLQRVLDIA